MEARGLEGEEVMYFEKRLVCYKISESSALFLRVWG